ncbi:MAG TPA: TRAP transporter substrate-binding protein DctP, partial [Pseudolabrys sp.]|nr:TRAP transporter substrate-binding protein DctP [Pseudolabrys sp.]
EIEVYFSGAISGVQSQQPQLVSDGTADLAIIVPGQLPERFHDNAVMELPGLYRNGREASQVFNRLIDANALEGYDDYVVIAAFVSGPENIHSRKPINSVDDLKGLVVRANNKIESEVLAKLGAIPVLLAINNTTEAISRGNIDAATFPPSMLFEFGIGRVTSNHFMLALGGAPTALVMNRKKFESLPDRAQQIIRRYSGDWLSDRSAEGLGALDITVDRDLIADQRRIVVTPSRSDLEVSQAAFDAVVNGWIASDPRNRDLLTKVRTELLQLRSKE